LAGDCAELELVEQPEGRQLLCLFWRRERLVSFYVLASKTNARVDKRNKMRLICVVWGLFLCTIHRTNVCALFLATQLYQQTSSFIVKDLIPEVFSIVWLHFA
jgi:hypothetical protein